MSRIGRQTISVPQGVTCEVQDQKINVRGPKGALSVDLQQGIEVNIENSIITVTRKNDEKQTKAFHGLVRSLVANAVEGVTNGFQKKLELVGTGYRAALQGSKLVLSLGFSHPVEVVQPEGIQFALEGNNKIIISGIDNHEVGQVAANIRKVRPPEPYKGKGIRYEGEVVRRKAGKAVKAASAS